MFYDFIHGNTASEYQRGDFKRKSWTLTISWRLLWGSIERPEAATFLVRQWNGATVFDEIFYEIFRRILL